MSGHFPLKQLAQTSATDGQTIQWSSALSSWVVANSATTTIKQVEVDFGVFPTLYGRFTISDAIITSSSHIIAVQSGNAAIGRSLDEAEMDPIMFSARAGNGVITITGRSLDGPVVGKYVVDYMVN